MIYDNIKKDSKTALVVVDSHEGNSSHSHIMIALRSEPHMKDIEEYFLVFLRNCSFILSLSISSDLMFLSE